MSESQLNDSDSVGKATERAVESMSRDSEALLKEELDNQTAIKEIMAAFDTDENTARELWGRFIEAVGKMKTEASNQNQAG